MPRLGILLLVLCLAGGCSLYPRQEAAHLGRQHGFQKRLFLTDSFTLYALYRPAQHGPAQNLRVYIEGDGRAWLSRSRPSADPTPLNPVALRLALADPSSADAILYLARPCQYVQGDQRRNCTVRYWTDARLAPEVIASLNSAVSQAKAASGATSVALVGFSGGGGAAVLMASERSDVVCLGTVAGNLDIDAWTTLLNISPLSRSLNPLDVAEDLVSIPQRHLSSRDDAIMPPEISAGFCRRSGRPENCRVVDGLEHGDAWERIWDYF